MGSHEYTASVVWTGNRGEGTRTYRGYGRDHRISFPGKPSLEATASVGAMIDPGRVNPDELLVAALASCHMLWYLHLCAEAAVVVEAYSDDAVGTLETASDGSGHFVEATLRPRVRLRSGDPDLAVRLHEEAHRRCFIASSVNFPVRCRPVLEPTSGAPAGAPG
jgi:organic hydroperoxide reductase OsmC/OhrA